jgi:hypothetical protein
VIAAGAAVRVPVLVPVPVLARLTAVRPAAPSRETVATAVTRDLIPGGTERFVMAWSEANIRGFDKEVRKMFEKDPILWGFLSEP